MPGIWETKTFMPRQPRQLKPNFCCHITVRCNNRNFRLTRLECVFVNDKIDEVTHFLEKWLGELL